MRFLIYYEHEGHQRNYGIFESDSAEGAIKLLKQHLLIPPEISAKLKARPWEGVPAK